MSYSGIAARGLPPSRAGGAQGRVARAETDVPGAGSFRVVVEEEPLLREPRRVRSWVLFNEVGGYELRRFRAALPAGATVYDAHVDDNGRYGSNLSLKDAAPVVVDEPAPGVRIFAPLSGAAVEDIVAEGARAGGCCDPSVAVAIVASAARAIAPGQPLLEPLSCRNVVVSWDGAVTYLGSAERWATTARHAPQRRLFEPRADCAALATIFAELVVGRIDDLSRWPERAARQGAASFVDVVAAALAREEPAVERFVAELSQLAAPATTAALSGFVRALFRDEWRVERQVREAVTTWQPQHLPPLRAR